MNGPLHKLRVLDLSRVLAGPWAGQLLGDYGADVVKVERPGQGDDTRQWGPPWLDDNANGESAYFLSTNRNKRSITVDLSAPEGQAVVRELALEADVLIENFRVGTMAKFGLGADSLCRDNPGLIYCSISAFGQTGSRAAEPGYDAMIQGSAGLMSVTGPASDNPAGPQKVGVAVADIMAGMYATTAILAALNARSESGAGQHIDVPLYDSQVAWLANQGLNYLVSGDVPTRLGTAHPNLVPYQCFATQDGNLILAVGNDAQFHRCCEVLGVDDMQSDKRFTSNAARVKNREFLVARLQEQLLQATTEEWLHRLSAVGVPCGPVNDIDEVLSNKHALERRLVRQMKNSKGQQVPTISNPVTFGETPVQYDSAPPLLGEHSESVLAEWLGYSPSRIEALREKNII